MNDQYLRILDDTVNLCLLEAGGPMFINLSQEQRLLQGLTKRISTGSQEQQNSHSDLTFLIVVLSKL